MTDEERAIEWLYPGEALTPVQIRKDPKIAQLTKRFAKHALHAEEAANASAQALAKAEKKLADTTVNHLRAEVERLHAALKAQLDMLPPGQTFASALHRTEAMRKIHASRAEIYHNALHIIWKDECINEQDRRDVAREALGLVAETK